MGLTYFKRFRMEIDLTDRHFPEYHLPPGYRLVSWRPQLVEAHAEVKYQSFRDEIDANVFACLGNFSGCLRLMDEISRKKQFLPQATWLLSYSHAGAEPEYCGTIQGLLDPAGFGAIQNIGITPLHRGNGLGTLLIWRSLLGFRHSGLPRVYLEVTAQNQRAIGLYERMGFRKARTAYKAVKMAILWPDRRMVR